MSQQTGPGWTKPVSLIQRASRHPETGAWQVENRRSPLDPDGEPLTVERYVASLPKRTYDSVVEAIADCTGSAMVAFELEDGAETHVLAMRRVTFASLPQFVSLPLTPGVERDAFQAAFPLSVRAHDLGPCSREASAYREICHEMGIDPDEGRMAFDPRCEALATALQDWMATSADADTQLLVHPILDMMRADRGPDPRLIDRVRKALPRFAGLGLPRFDEIEAFVRSPERLVASTQAPIDWSFGATGGVCVKFLASKHGRGWLATISYHYDETAPDGWNGVASGLRGVALLPEASEFARDAWLAVAVRRLEEQGVRFLTAPAAVEYMEYEGAHWLRQWTPEPEPQNFWDRVQSAIRIWTPSPTREPTPRRAGS